MFAAENKPDASWRMVVFGRARNQELQGALVGVFALAKVAFVVSTDRSVGGWVDRSVGGWVDRWVGVGDVHTLIEHAWAPSPGNTNHVCFVAFFKSIDRGLHAPTR